MVGLFAFMNYSKMSKRSLALHFAGMSKKDQKKTMIRMMNKHSPTDDEKSPFEMMGPVVQKMLMALWIEETVDNPTGVISVALLKRAPDSKKRAQLNIDNSYKLDPAMVRARALLKESSPEDLLKIVGGRTRGKRPVMSIEDADYTVIEE